MRALTAILLLAAATRAQHLDDAQAAALIEKARARALAYTSSLPDFICTEMIHRYHDPRGDNRWQTLDVLTVKLSFFGRREDYKLVEIDGKPTQTDFMKTGGPTTKGEFGTLLLYLFHPQMAAEFRFKGFTTIHKRRAGVYTFKVDQAHTQFHVTYGAAAEGPNHIVAPYFGEVAVDPESGSVLRMSHHAILPLSFPIKESSSSVEYDEVEVGDQRYLLPVHAEATMAAGRYKSRNVVEFRDYRKFGSEATITFDK